MQSAIKPSQERISEMHTDITEPALGAVQVQTDPKGILWVNVDGVCLLRICQIKNLIVNGKLVTTATPVQLNGIPDASPT